jgi:hypothetical protein
MDDRERKEPLRTQEMASAPAGSTEDVRNAADRAERERWMRREGDPRHEGDVKAALFPESERNQLRSQWTEIQGQFVDEPRHSVEKADGLVAQSIKRLAESFAEARAHLEEQWSRGGDVSTEDLRVALQRYRSFFDRLLAV